MQNSKTTELQLTIKSTLSTLSEKLGSTESPISKLKACLCSIATVLDCQYRLFFHSTENSATTRMKMNRDANSIQSVLQRFLYNTQNANYFDQNTYEGIVGDLDYLLGVLGDKYYLKDAWSNTDLAWNLSMSQGPGYAMYSAQYHPNLHMQGMPLAPVQFEPHQLTTHQYGIPPEAYSVQRFTPEFMPTMFNQTPIAAQMEYSQAGTQQPNRFVDCPPVAYETNIKPLDSHINDGTDPNHSNLVDRSETVQLGSGIAYAAVETDKMQEETDVLRRPNTIAPPISHDESYDLPISPKSLQMGFDKSALEEEGHTIANEEQAIETLTEEMAVIAQEEALQEELEVVTGEEDDTTPAQPLLEEEEDFVIRKRSEPELQEDEESEESDDSAVEDFKPTISASSRTLTGDPIEEEEDFVIHKISELELQEDEESDESDDSAVEDTKQNVSVSSQTLKDTDKVGAIKQQDNKKKKKKKNNKNKKKNSKQKGKLQNKTEELEETKTTTTSKPEKTASTEEEVFTQTAKETDIYPHVLLTKALEANDYATWNEILHEHALTKEMMLYFFNSLSARFCAVDLDLDKAQAFISGAKIPVKVITFLILHKKINVQIKKYLFSNLLGVTNYLDFFVNSLKYDWVEIIEKIKREDPNPDESSYQQFKSYIEIKNCIKSAWADDQINNLLDTPNASKTLGDDLGIYARHPHRESGRTPLMLYLQKMACEDIYNQKVLFELVKVSDLTQRCFMGRTVLHYLMQYHSFVGIIQVLIKVLGAIASLDLQKRMYATYPDNDLCTCLHLLIETAKDDVLCKAIINVFARFQRNTCLAAILSPNNRGETVFHTLAAKNQDLPETYLALRAVLFGDVPLTARTMKNISKYGLENTGFENYTLLYAKTHDPLVQHIEQDNLTRALQIIEERHDLRVGFRAGLMKDDFNNISSFINSTELLVFKDNNFDNIAPHVSLVFKLMNPDNEEIALQFIKSLAFQYYDLLVPCPIRLSWHKVLEFVASGCKNRQQYQPYIDEIQKNINEKDMYHKYPIQYAIEFPNLPMLKFLVNDLGAFAHFRENIENKLGLFYAARMAVAAAKSTSTVKVLPMSCVRDMFAMLIEAGEDLTELRSGPDMDANALHLPIGLNDFDMLVMFVESLSPSQLKRMLEDNNSANEDVFAALDVMHFLLLSEKDKDMNAIEVNRRMSMYLEGHRDRVKYQSTKRLALD